VAQFLALVAAALSKAGKPGDGLLKTDAALAAVERTGEREYEAEVYRVRDELLLAQDSSNAKQPSSRSSPLSRSREHSSTSSRPIVATS